MNKRFKILTLVFFAVAVPATSGIGEENSDEILLWDGFVLTGVNGKLISTVLPGKSEKTSDSDTHLERGPKLSSSQSGWFFELGEDVNDLRVKASTGMTLELLPSSTLEKLIADVNERYENSYSLSGWVTKYKGENFIFPIHFLPISTIDKQQPPIEQKPKRAIQSTLKKEAEQPVESEPNDLLAMPKEIMERLSPSRTVRPRIPRQKLKTGKKVFEQDSILADRSAFLVKQNDGRFMFVLDAFGRNVWPVSLQLLPCEALELTELTQTAIPEPVRFKIAGIVTKYNAEKYLLLQRAARVYSHGNFAR